MDRDSPVWVERPSEKVNGSREKARELWKLETVHGDCVG